MRQVNRLLYIFAIFFLWIGLQGCHSTFDAPTNETNGQENAGDVIEVNGASINVQEHVATFFSGNGYQRLQGVNVTQSGVISAGNTSSSNLGTYVPSSARGWCTKLNQGCPAVGNGNSNYSDGYVLKMSRDLKNVIGFSYFGAANANDRLYGAVEDPRNGDVVAVGFSEGNVSVTAGMGHQGKFDTMIVKFSPDLKQRRCSALVGGSESENPRFSVAVDQDGSIVVSGQTRSNDFLNNDSQWIDSGPPNSSSSNLDNDGFVVKFDEYCSVLWARYLGGSADDGLRAGVVLDNDSNIYVAGYTESDDFPSTTSICGGPCGDRDAIVAKYNSSGTMLYTVRFGGSGFDEVSYNQGLTLKSGNAPVITGITKSSNFSGVSFKSYKDQHSGIVFNDADDFDSFVAIIKADGSEVLAATYIGGRFFDEASGIGTDAGGNIMVGGTTRSDDLGTTNNAIQSNYNAGGNDPNTQKPYLDGFLYILDPRLEQAKLVSYFGGTKHDRIRSLSLDQNNKRFCFSGDTNSLYPSIGGTFPVTPGVWDETRIGSVDNAIEDAFIGCLKIR